MNFCSNCAHPVQFKMVEGDNRPRYVCDACNTIHYQNPNIVAGCLPIWEDQVLLCKRAIEPRLGYWNLPSGYLENEETVEDGAVREVMEEACIEVEIIALHAVFSIPHISQVYMHFLAEMPDVNFAPGVESLEVALFKEEDIPWKEIAFSSSIFSLKHYFADRKNGRREVHLGKFEF
ncbi:MAG: NUDIX hydrolase [Bacteroidota bacterium]